MLCYFFFQAEDGIRDLVRSRGLGDVYKRQGVVVTLRAAKSDENAPVSEPRPQGSGAASATERPVSYTHLTLPTSDLVEISVVAVSLKKKKPK